MQIEEQLRTAIRASLPEKLAKLINPEEIVLEQPKDSNFGDFSTNLAMLKYD